MRVLEAVDVSKDYREGACVVHALRHATLFLDLGQVVALEGPSGSGKTTLLSILGCILTATAGNVVIDGQQVDPRRPKTLNRIRKKSIGFVFQHYNLIPALTALENVQYALNIRGLRGRLARREAERALDRVALGDRRHSLPRDLSGGQKQRVSIARALAGNAPVLLADEPTANLDSETGAQVLDLFRTLAKTENRALLIVTHDPKVRSICDDVLLIRDGVLRPLQSQDRTAAPLAPLAAVAPETVCTPALAGLAGTRSWDHYSSPDSGSFIWREAGGFAVIPTAPKISSGSQG